MILFTRLGHASRFFQNLNFYHIMIVVFDSTEEISAKVAGNLLNNLDFAEDLEIITIM